MRKMVTISLTSKSIKHADADNRSNSPERIPEQEVSILKYAWQNISTKSKTSINNTH
jgi:hypothetical protein